MHLRERVKTWRERRREEREAVAQARQEQLRAGDEPQRSQADVVEDTAGQFPPS